MFGLWDAVFMEMATLKHAFNAKRHEFFSLSDY